MFGYISGHSSTTREWFVHLPEVVFVFFFSAVEHGGSTKGFQETKEERSESIFVSMLCIKAGCFPLESTFYGSRLITLMSTDVR